jgi:solute carrier family 25 oxoglutarate transporter 11
MSSTINSAKETAKDAISSAKDSISDAPKAMQAVVENPKQSTTSFLHNPVIRAALPFVNGGLAGMTATAVIQPVDMIKVAFNWLEKVSRLGQNLPLYR